MATGPSSSQSPYLVASEPNVRFVSIATVGDALDTKADGVTPYRMVGIPDGLGAFDNGNGTFTLLMNHELPATAGVVREHGSTGAFVSQLVIDSTTLSVLDAKDAIRNVSLFDPLTDGFVSGTTAFARFCSADLADQTAYLNSASGLGTSDRIYLTGEETGPEGRGFAIVVTGAEAGTAYELASLGNFSYENSLASPFVQDKTVVISTDDVNEGQLYVYVGEKQATGNVVEKAGLVGGDLYGIKVEGLALETNATAASGRFSLQEMGPGGDASGLTGAQLEAESDAEGVTGFLRPEDGQWDSNNPNVFYFVTTASNETNSRLYRATFDDITNPTAGGTIEALLSGDEGHRMLDNMTVSDEGLVILQEDPGNSGRLAKVWSYDPATDKLTEIAQHDPARFAPPAQPPFNTNEESSGVIDVTSILGDADTKAYLLDVQAHYGIADPELVEGGQLLAMFVDDVVTEGGSGNDRLFGSAADETFTGRAGNDEILAGSGNDTINAGTGNDFINGGNGNDSIIAGEGDDEVDGNNDDDTIQGNGGNDRLDGGDGNDVINAGAGEDRVIGGGDDDKISGGAGDDEVNGSDGDDQVDGGIGNDQVLGGDGNDKLAGGEGNDVLTGGLGLDDMTGGAGDDRFVFLSVADSGVASSDIVRAFGGGDVIDLSAIDAISGGETNEAFTLVGAFSGTAGQLVVSQLNGPNYAVLGDTDGNGVADFRIVMIGSGPLDASDFIL